MISIILPFYNNRDTLPRCVDSILSQTYRDFELIAVSDGGSDGSLALMQKYARRDNRVVPVDAAHGGVSHARNTGLANAKGEYIQFIDADDWMEPRMLELMHKALKKHHADVCACRFFHPCLQNDAAGRVYDLTDKRELLSFSQHAFAGVVPWNKLFRREVITQPFDQNLHFCEDEMFWLANLWNAHRVVNLDQKLYHYEVDSNSCIGSIAAGRFWEGERSVWTMRRDLKEISRSILADHLQGEMLNEMVHLRLFDFFLWGQAIYLSSGADVEGMVCEAQRILQQPEFLRSLWLKRQYGVGVATGGDQPLTQKARQFVELSYAYHRNPMIALNDYDVYLGLFVRLFLEPIGILDPIDSCAAMLEALAWDSTPEARYVNDVCCPVEENEQELPLAVAAAY